MDQTPDLAWQYAKKPHEWQDVIRNAIHILHDPAQTAMHEEAKEALADATEALHLYDENENGSWSELLGALRANRNNPDPNAQADISFNPEPLKNALPALAGELHSGAQLAEGLATLPYNAARAGKAILTQPVSQTEDQLSALADKFFGAVGNFVHHPIRTMEEATPEEYGNAAVQAGAMLAPAARLGGTGELLSAAEAAAKPSLAGTVGRGLARSVGSVARVPGRAIDAVSSYLERPRLTNEKIAAQTEQAAAQSAKAASQQAGQEYVNANVYPQRAAKAAADRLTAEAAAQHAPALRASNAAAAAERLRAATEINPQRMAKLVEEVGRGPAETHGVDLDNIIKEMKIEMMRGKVAPSELPDESGLMGGPQAPGEPTFETPPTSRGPAPTPKVKNAQPFVARSAEESMSGKPVQGVNAEGPPTPPKPTARVMSKAEKALESMRGPKPKAPFQFPPFEETMRMARKRKWPGMSDEEIEAALRQVQQAQEQGYTGSDTWPHLYHYNP